MKILTPSTVVGLGLGIGTGFGIFAFQANSNAVKAEAVAEHLIDEGKPVQAIDYQNDAERHRNNRNIAAFTMLINFSIAAANVATVAKTPETTRNFIEPDTSIPK